MPPLIHFKSVFARRALLLLVAPLYFIMLFGIRIGKGALSAFSEFAEMFTAVWKGEETSEDLLPCPFCGGKAYPDGWRANGGASGPACDQCGATTWSAHTWNTRIPLPLDKAPGEPE